MSENASHIIVHHYIDSSNLSFMGMVCCIVLVVVIVVLLVILIGIMIYIVVDSGKCRRSRKVSHTKKSRVWHTKKSRSPKRYAFNNLNDMSSCNGIGTTASTVGDFDEGIHPNTQSIPLSALRNKTTDKRVDSSESSAGLYDVLFPEQHDGEILYDPPTKLVTFAGQVYASNRQNTRGNSGSGPSGSGRNCEAASESLEWDYFQQNRQVETENPDNDLEVDPDVIYNVCWV